jgi:hypothetical protein
VFVKGCSGSGYNKILPTLFPVLAVRLAPEDLWSCLPGLSSSICSLFMLVGLVAGLTVLIYHSHL